MASHSFTVSSPLSQADAFARLVDLERVPEWDDGVSASQRIGDTEPARYDVTVTGFDGRPTTVVYEVTERKAPERFVMVGENEIFRAEDELRLTPGADGRGCELSYRGSLDLVGSTPPLTDDQLDSMFPKIAAVAEAGLTRFLNPESP